MTKGNPELATVQSNGFITHYNPEVSGSTEVNVPMQNKSVPTMTNDMKVNKNG
jgi:hypothetical protein